MDFKKRPSDQVDEEKVCHLTSDTKLRSGLSFRPCALCAQGAVEGVDTLTRVNDADKTAEEVNFMQVHVSSPPSHLR